MGLRVRKDQPYLLSYGSSEIEHHLTSSAHHLQHPIHMALLEQRKAAKSKLLRSHQDVPCELHRWLAADPMFGKL